MTATIDTALESRVYAPLDTERSYAVRQIDGTLPNELTGTLYRIGPGHHHLGKTLLHNIFDGDGMISQFVLDGRGVHYRNRYVRTKTYAGADFVGVGTRRPLANPFSLPGNVANTNVIEYAGGLLALWEIGNPHKVDADTLETIGPFDFGGNLGFLGAFSAHPKWDPVTGEMFNFGLDLLPTPRIRTYRVEANGRLHQLASLPMLDLPWNHDFALTQRYLVFVLDPILPDVASLALTRESFIDCLTFQPSKGTRFVLAPRTGGKARIVEHDAVLHFHVTNAYDDGADVVIEFVQFDDTWEHVRNLTNQINRSNGVQFPKSRLMQYRITPNGRVIKTELADLSMEFPQYDWRLSTRKHAVSYAAAVGPGSIVYNTIAKVDHTTGATTTCEFDSGSVGEPLFVPRTPDAAEDDGWLLALNHDLREHRSQLVVLDARDVERGPLATAWLDHHIPWGFHGTFTRKQARLLPS